MTRHSSKQILQSIAEACQNKNLRLTQKRQQIMRTLIEAEEPVSAYELAELYKTAYGETIPVMSIYRILDFFSENKFVHKLSSTNKYVTCAHITCDHAHEAPQFLICHHCRKVSEIYLDESLIRQLQTSIQAKGFLMEDHQLELQALCHNCSEKDVG